MDTAGIRSLLALFFITLFTVLFIPTTLAQEASLAFANFGQADEVCAAGAPGEYACADIGGETSRSSAVAAGRFNGDDHVDIVFSIDWEPNRICLGAGDGSFECSDVSAHSHSSRDVAAADFNGDGGLDVVFANVGQRNQICFGNGEGGFTCSDLSTHVQNSAGVAAADFNGDGHPDIAINNFGQTDLVCLNDGTGAFTCQDPGSPVRKGQRLTTLDANGDGHVDLAFANQDQPNSLCLGDGSGGFTCGDISSSSESTFGVAAVDLDGDGTADLAFANAGQADTVCLNDGSGSFACSPVDTLVRFTLGVAATDVNADDHPDLVFAVRDGRNRACLGDGSGSFTCEDLGPDTESTVAVATLIHGTDQSGDPADGIAFLDSDGDGVEDAIDQCPNTVIPESVPTRRLLPNHFALIDADAVFDTYSLGRATRGSSGWTTSDTRGCSCEQIIAATSEASGHMKFGCPFGLLHYWINLKTSDGAAAEAGGQAVAEGEGVHGSEGEVHNLEASSISASNYPNPFNPATTIRIDLKQSGPVSLIIYDAMGREVDVLADGVYDAGVHELTFRADNLPSGLYLYRLETPHGRMQRSMTLLK